MEKYCWLNINTGAFSNSWNSELQKSYLTEKDIENMKNSGWKLIKFECISDSKFEFTNQMKLR